MRVPSGAQGREKQERRDPREESERAGEQRAEPGAEMEADWILELELPL